MSHLATPALGAKTGKKDLNPATTTEKRTRRRTLQSCRECRRRKLFCDRTLPACGRCVKAGKGTDCLYLKSRFDNPPEVSKSQSGTTSAYTRPSRQTTESTTPPAYIVPSRLEEKSRNIRQLLSHSTVAYRESRKGSFSTASNKDGRAWISDPVEVRGSGFKTQFHGGTYANSMLRLQGFQTFIEEIYEQFPTFIKARAQMRDAEKSKPDDKNSITVLSDAELVALIPPKPETDECVQLFLDHYGSMTRIFDIPTFWKTYEEMWSDLSLAEIHFVAMILVIVSASKCLLKPQPNPFTSRYQSDFIIDAVNAKLTRRSQRMANIADLQVRVLLLFAKQTSARKFKRNNDEIGDLVASCMATGLHQDHAEDDDDVDSDFSISLHNSKLRRRIWSTVVEMEIQSSFDRGLISVIPMTADFQDFDQCKNDSHDGNTEDSYEIAARRSRALRLSLNAYLNDIRRPMVFDEVKEHTDDLQTQIEALVDSQNLAEVPRAVLMLQLRQYKLALHTGFLMQAKTKTERDISILVIVQEASQVIEAYRLLSGTAKLSLELLRNDLLRAALSICHAVGVNATEPNTDAALLAWSEKVASGIVSTVVKSLTDKVIQLGREWRQLWNVLVAKAFISSQKNPLQRLQYMSEAVTCMIEANNASLAAQADAGFCFEGSKDALDQQNDRTSTELPELLQMNIFSDDFTDMDLDCWLSMPFGYPAPNLQLTGLE